LDFISNFCKFPGRLPDIYFFKSIQQQYISGNNKYDTEQLYFKMYLNFNLVDILKQCKAYHIWNGNLQSFVSGTRRILFMTWSNWISKYLNSNFVYIKVIIIIIYKVAILVRHFIQLDIDKVPRWDENVVIQQSVYFFITLFCVLCVVLQTISEVYNLFYLYSIVIP